MDYLHVGHAFDEQSDTEEPSTTPNKLQRRENRSDSNYTKARRKESSVSDKSSFVLPGIGMNLGAFQEFGRSRSVGSPPFDPPSITYTKQSLLLHPLSATFWAQ